MAWKEKTTAPVIHKVRVCDLCQREMGSGDRSCWICKSDCCYQCAKLFFAAKHDELIEFAIHVCTHCQTQADIIREIRRTLATANDSLKAQIELWRDWKSELPKA